MSTHTPDGTPPQRGLKIKSPGQKSQGLKIVAPGSESHQLKMIKPSSDNSHQLKIKTPSSIHPDNASEQLEEIESFDPLATYVQHQETLYDMEERKRTEIIEQEEKLRKLEEMQEQRLRELEERLELERKKLQEEKMKFEHAKREEEVRHQEEEEFIKKHEREDEKRWIEYEEKIKQEEELKKKLEELEKNKEELNQPVDKDPAETTKDETLEEEVDPTDDAPITLEKKRHTDTSTCKAINPLNSEASSQSAQEELLKHTVDVDREELLKTDKEEEQTLPSSESGIKEEENTPDHDPQKTLVQLDPYAINPDELDTDTDYIEEENTHEAIPLNEQLARTTGGFTPCFYVIDEKGIRMTPIEEDDVIFNFGRGKDNECIINDKSISETQMRAIHFKGRWTFMDTGVRDTLSFNGIKSRQLTTTSESRTAIKCGNSWIIHVGLDSSKSEGTDTQILKRSILNNIPEPYVDDACVTLSYRNKARSSTMAPILAGSHASCDFRMEILKPFHFIIYWSQVGLYMEDLTKGHPGVFLGDRRISGNTGISHTISITAGKTRFDVVVTGTQDTHRQALADAHNNKQRLKLMPVSSQLSPIILTPGLRNLVIGRNEESDLMIKDISVSRRHAKISIRDKSVMLEDLKSINGTKVNLEKVKRSIVVPGDVVTIGNVSFLLCYEELSRTAQ
ncbi:FHA domain-containing protein [Lentisphaera marina]|uniref:FHA domain-containing protein n=1 Tax=Lentisphaera marina TaxID=1111041 RepID=UPI002366583F|nr:FHA domain-containing protein [Lentisphaera marina]MDD7986734.1 FHA domain-containing protein [Lentisphaera marina]